jgi:hypothetical protein
VTCRRRRLAGAWRCGSNDPNRDLQPSLGPGAEPLPVDGLRLESPDERLRGGVIQRREGCHFADQKVLLSFVPRSAAASQMTGPGREARSAARCVARSRAGGAVAEPLRPIAMPRMPGAMVARARYPPGGNSGSVGTGQAARRYSWISPPSTSTRSMDASG